MDFPAKVIAVTNAIPFGKVLNYGRIAQLLDSPHAARAVGYALGNLPFDSPVPWQRVVGKNGIYGAIVLRGSPQAEHEQIARLKEEGIVFDAQRQFILMDYLWQVSPLEVLATLDEAEHRRET